jgi:hypothetical protein
VDFHTAVEFFLLLFAGDGHNGGFVGTSADVNFLHRYTVLSQPLTNGSGSLQGDEGIVRSGADAIGVAFNDEMRVAVDLDESRELLQADQCRALEAALIEVEQHVCAQSRYTGLRAEVALTDKLGE